MTRALYSIESEHALLGAVLQDNSLVDDMMSVVSVADFHDLDCAFLFNAILRQHEAGAPFDAVTVGSDHPIMPSGDVTIAFAAELAHNVPSAANWRAYAQVVRERSVLRTLVATAQVVTDMAGDDKPVAQIIANAQQAMADLRDLDDGRPDYRRMSEVAGEVVEDMQEELDGRKVDRLSTGLPDLDQLMGGLRQKSMIVIAGRPGSGKTTLGLQIAQHIAVRDRGVAAVFSLEMGDQELTRRSIASLGGVDLRRMEDARKLDGEEWQRITGAVKSVNEAEMYLCDTAGLTMPRIRTVARQIQRNHGLSVVVVDYIGLIAPAGRYASRAEAIGAISTSLKNLAKELSVPVLALAQLNRDSTKRAGNKRPQASDLRDSGQIEQDADMVILVHKDLETEQGQNGITELILDKARQAQAGMCVVQHQGQFSRFVSVLPQRQDPDELEASRPFQGRYQRGAA